MSGMRCPQWPHDFEPMPFPFRCATHQTTAAIEASGTNKTRRMITSSGMPMLFMARSIADLLGVCGSIRDPYQGQGLEISSIACPLLIFSKVPVDQPAEVDPALRYLLTRRIIRLAGSRRIMNGSHVPRIGLPVRRSLSLAYGASVATAILAAVSSVLALLDPARVYPAANLLRAFLANDVTNLVIGMPILLVSIWLAVRGLWAGLLLWPGALLYVLYNYLVPLLCTPFNLAFVLHLALVTASLYTMIGLMTSVDGSEVKQRLAGFVPEKFSGAVLAGLAIVTFLRATSLMTTCLLKGTQIDATDLALAATDILMATGAELRVADRRSSALEAKNLRVLVGLGLLFQASMLFIGLIVFLIVEQRTTGARTSVVVADDWRHGHGRFDPVGTFHTRYRNQRMLPFPVGYWKLRNMKVRRCLLRLT